MIQLIQADALEWLRDPVHAHRGPIVTGLPDMHELPGVGLAV